MKNSPSISSLLKELDTILEFFERSTKCFTEEDSSFRPTETSLSVAEQIAHAAQSIDWFLEGMSRPEGFDMDFEKHWIEVKQCISLTSARKWLKNSINHAKEYVTGISEDQLHSPLPEGFVMGGEPKYSVIYAMAEHTAHHRGALTVYARLLNKIPSMPYADM